MRTARRAWPTRGSERDLSGQAIARLAACAKPAIPCSHVEKPRGPSIRPSDRSSTLSRNRSPRELLTWPRYGQASETRSKAVIRGMARPPPCPGTSRVSA